jgi:hypothetical protein
LVGTNLGSLEPTLARWNQPWFVGTNLGSLEPTLVRWNQPWFVGTNIGWLEPTLVGCWISRESSLKIVFLESTVHKLSVDASFVHNLGVRGDKKQFFSSCVIEKDVKVNII